MSGEILFSIVLVIALGIGSQWLAWRIRVPSILLLLIVGFLAGPVTEMLEPASLQGEWLFAFVSLAIGIILFEGGLTLRVKELRGVGVAVLNLITIGVLVTGILAGLAAWYLLDMPPGMAAVIGATLTVTGPTVVLPLLRYVRPTGRVNAIAKWEGITIDPVGAILAVLVLEVVLVVADPANADASGELTEALLHSLQALLSTVAVSLGVSLLGAALLVLVLRRHLVPDYLQSSVALMVVVGVFALSNLLHEESGLFAVTMMGVLMANQPYVTVRTITKFKEDLQVLLIACLFILLSARLDIGVLAYFDQNAFLFLGILILLVRPIAVALSCLGTPLSWKEQAFIAWLAPRGIVAAAVAALFAVRMEPIYGAQSDALVPIVYLVIVGTVAVYGLTLFPLARSLGMADSNPQGILFMGAHPWVQSVAKAVQQSGFRVLLIDTNERNIAQAKEHGLPAMVADGLSEFVFDELDLSGIRRFMATTSNDDTNSLAALHFTEVFEASDVFQLASRDGEASGVQRRLPIHLRGRPLFGAAHTHAALAERFKQGGEVRAYVLTKPDDYENIRAQSHGEVLLMLIARGTQLLVQNETQDYVPQADDTVIAMLPSYGEELGKLDAILFEELITRSLVLDLEGVSTKDGLAAEVAREMSVRLPVPASQLAAEFREALLDDTLQLSPSVAIPHVRVTKIAGSQVALVRCSEPVALDDTGRTAQFFLFLVSPTEHPRQVYRVLEHVSAKVNNESFAARMREASDHDAIRALVSSPAY